MRWAKRLVFNCNDQFVLICDGMRVIIYRIDYVSYKTNNYHFIFIENYFIRHLDKLYWVVRDMNKGGRVKHRSSLVHFPALGVAPPNRLACGVTSGLGTTGMQANQT